jgi:hypothetical protein
MQRGPNVSQAIGAARRSMSGLPPNVLQNSTAFCSAGSAVFSDTALPLGSAAASTPERDGYAATGLKIACQKFCPSCKCASRSWRAKDLRHPDSVISDRIVAQNQSDDPRPDSPVRVRYAQPRSPVSAVLFPSDSGVAITELPRPCITSWARRSGGGRIGDQPDGVRCH